MQQLEWSLSSLLAFSMSSKVKRHIALALLCGAVATTQIACGLFSKTKPEPVAQRILKKKIVMTAFAVNVPMQVHDLDDISQGFPRELLSRLENTGLFMVRQSPNLLSYGLQQETPSAKLVKQVATESDAQFVIAGEVRNAGIRSDKKYFGLWETRSRHIEIEFSIYDGATGAYLMRHHLYRPSEDDSEIGRDRPFGSVAFFATKYGKAIDAVLEDALTKIRQDLAVYPMVARIVKIDGKQLILDVGINANLRVGDAGLVVADYEQLPSNGLSALQNQALQLGPPQASMGKIKVIQLQQGFAVAELAEQIDSPVVKVKVGDLVRFDPEK